jgi:predicted nucleic acid-binding protein
MIAPKFTAILDACVLYPAPLRDLLLQLATAGLFRARWTDDIHAEWIRGVLQNRDDLTLAQLTRTKDKMNEGANCHLIEGYQPIIDTLELPDPNDRHVLAAAIRGRVDVIVTRNLKDFPAEYLRKFDVEALHPDEFIADLIDLSQTTVIEAVRIIRARLKNPPYSTRQYIETLEGLELAETAAFLTTAEALI